MQEVTGELKSIEETVRRAERTCEVDLRILTPVNNRSQEVSGGGRTVIAKMPL